MPISFLEKEHIQTRPCENLIKNPKTLNFQTKKKSTDVTNA